jgi:hypothetical protein
MSGDLSQNTRRGCALTAQPKLALHGRGLRRIHISITAVSGQIIILNVNQFDRAPLFALDKLVIGRCFVKGSTAWASHVRLIAAPEQSS